MANRSVGANRAAGWAFVLTALLAGCGAPQVEQRALPQPNPTSYEFAASVEAVHHAIDSLYSQQFRERPLNTFSVIKPEDELLTDEQGARFDRPGGENDRLLWYMHSPLGLSTVYFVGGEPAPYVADFYLKIEPLVDAATRVTVEALDTEVIAGKTLLPRHEFSRANIYVPVSPTTVEEYQFLLQLGRILGQTGMSALQTPSAPARSRLERLWSVRPQPTKGRLR